MVTWDNYEEYLVMLADGELDATGQKELEEFMAIHPEVREELALFETVRFTPDATQVFENKESLLRSEPKGMVISLNQWIRYGAAAGMLALVAFGAMKWQQRQTGTTEVVANNDNKTGNITQVKVTDTPHDTVIEEQPIARNEQPKVQKLHKTVQQPAVQKSQVARQEKAAKTLFDETPVKLEITAVEKMELKPVYHETAQVKALPRVNINAPAPEPDHDALAWLPLDQERKQGFNEVKDALSARLEKAKEIRDNIRNTDMAVKLGKKELFVVRF